MSEDVKELFELIDKRDQTEGNEIARELRRLGRSGYVLNRNYEEFVNAIKKYENDPSLWNMKNRSN